MCFLSNRSNGILSLSSIIGKPWFANSAGNVELRYGCLPMKISGLGFGFAIETRLANQGGFICVEGFRLNMNKLSHEAQNSSPICGQENEK
jgi:hypothetical protein